MRTSARYGHRTLTAMPAFATAPGFASDPDDLDRQRDRLFNGRSYEAVPSFPLRDHGTGSGELGVRRHRWFTGGTGERDRLIRDARRRPHPRRTS